MQLTNVVLLEDEVERARGVLARLVEESAADAALLLLRSGEIAAQHVETPLGDHLDTLGALLAGNFASAREIARVLGESGFESQLQQGSGRHVVTHAVGDGWLLSVVFAQASSLGLVRVLARGAADELRPLNETARQRGAASVTSKTFGRSAARAIDDLFGERR